MSESKNYSRSLECLNAIQDTINPKDWLHKYFNLFKQCSIQPQGRPRITLSFHEDEHFQEIEDFVKLYLTRMDEMYKLK